MIHEELGKYVLIYGTGMEKKAWARYEDFKISGDLYTLNVGTYDDSSTAGNGFGYNNGFAFSTSDRDNDVSTSHCAKQNEGAWWHGGCSFVQLTGVYYSGPGARRPRDGIVWHLWKGDYYSLKQATMKMRETTP